ncbi:MAG: flagellar basal-body MS-ring/collar protein FliF [Archangium sp.]
METLLKQLRELPARLAALPAGLRYAMIGGALLAVIVAVAVGGVAKGGSDYQYVFTNLSSEDATMAGGALNELGIPYRIEANGTALAVPSEKVYDARISLLSRGLPKAANVGFKLFDNGDLGVSEFTQRVNLRRAIEGELANTISHFAGVKSATVTMTLAEKGLYRDEDKKASAAVTLSMQPGRKLGERELAGIRHLVSSAAAGLSADQISIIDENSGLLESDSDQDSPTYQRKLEHDLEQKVVALLAPVVGRDAVIARVSATLDLSHVNQNSEIVDPDSVVLKNETTSSGSSSNQSNQPQMVTGAIANVPLVPQQPQQGATQQGNSSQNSSSKNYEISKTTTQTVARVPRLTKLSVAVVIDGVDGKPRSAEEVARLSELARKAVGFDELRGDQFELTSQPFGRSAEVPEAPVVAAVMPVWQQVAIGAGILAGLIVAFLIFRRVTKKAPAEQLVLQPGATVAALEAKQNAIDGVATEQPKAEPQPLLVDPLQDMKDKARALLREDPERALMLVRAWLSADLEKQVENNTHG